MRHARVHVFASRRLNARRLISESLEPRHLLASDVGDEQLLHNWVPPTEEIAWGDVSLRMSPTATTDDWQAKLAPYAERLSTQQGGSPSFRINDLRYDASTATTFVYLQQTVNGLDVVNAYANLAVHNSGQVTAGYTSFVSTDKLADSVQLLASLSPESALQSLASHYGWPDATSASISALSPLSRAQTPSLRAPTLAREAVEYASVYVPGAAGHLELAWRLNVQPLASNSWLDAAVSQSDGGVLFVADWTSNAQYEVFAYPKESPSDGPRTRVIDPANSTTSPFGWHDTDGEVGVESVRTRGNNTIAYRDTDANNRPDLDSYVNGGASLIFAPPLDLTREPTTYAEASTVNLFYTTNRLHDVFANKGFYAEAGNFQRNNYDASRGLADDPLLAEDLDGGGFNNASMSVPPDGRRPRMQMQLFTNTTPARSSSLDNGIIAHEFAHGVTIRLTGGPNNSSSLATLQSRALGEGWSDFFSLLFTQTSSDTAAQGRGMGTYLLGQPADGPGMRTQRYSYDMSVNTLTFANLVGATEAHVMGEVWAATLWDLNWALIGGSTLDPSLHNAPLGFNTNLNATTGGNNVAFRTVLYALKIQPVNPTFLQARDAILRADQLLNGGANQETIWRVFARRGMGLSAVGNSASSSQVTAAFDIPVVGTIDFDRQGLLGSGISTVSGHLANVLGVNGSQTLNFAMATNSRVSMTLTPASPSAQLTVVIRNADGSVARAAEQGAVGAPVFIPSWSAGVAGDFRLEVSASSVTRVSLQAARNAVLESQVGDSSSSAEMGLNNSFRSFERGGVQAVIGAGSSGYRFSKSNDASKFIDISGNGTRLDLADDSWTVIQTTVGNSIIPAGSVVINNNGAILAGGSRSLGYSNFPLSSFPTSFPSSLFAYWDDIDGGPGAVYYREQSVGGIPTLIVQWDNRPHFSRIGNATFQLQLFASGPVYARYAYKDVVFGNTRLDNGASATIGLIGPDQTAQFSHETAAVFDNDYIDVFDNVDVDEYRFSAVAGQRLDVAFDALGVTSTSATIQLLDEANVVLATATNRPISNSTAIGNYDLGILGFVVPATGDYSLRALVQESVYYLAIGESLAIDTENSSGVITPVRSVTLPGAAMGYLSASDTRDLLSLPLAIGQSIRVVLTRPDTAVVAPRNSLQPRLNITDPTGAIVATNSTFNTAGQIVLSLTATQAGLHRIDLRRLSGEGEYYFRVEQVIAPAALAPLPFAANSTTMPSAWHNLAQPMDVSDDLQITAYDALLLINELNTRRISSGTGQLPPRAVDAEVADLLFDTNGDGFLTAVDALLVINQLNGI